MAQSAPDRAIVKVVDTPFGKRPLRVHIDPASDGAEVVNGVADRVRGEFLRRIGLGDLLQARAGSPALLEFIRKEAEMT